LRDRQVPAIAYGSPKSDPEHPSAESAKIAESLVLLEFVADLYPDSGLLPKDPVQRARVRFFIDAVAKATDPYVTFMFRGEAPDNFIAAVATIQELLSPNGFAVGDQFTIADAAIAPFLGRWELLLRNDVGKYAEGTGPRVHEILFRSERFARLQKYFANISSRQSFKNSFDSVRVSRVLADSVLIRILTGILARQGKGEVGPTESVKRSSLYKVIDTCLWMTNTIRLRSLACAARGSVRTDF
jgi:glutathione S-transferase